ncbi:STAS domain-containing protein [Phycicoccus sp. M110.8]|uniref:STAS domain-containing protein n=1 Tax=Phycicoccus sp. M110.8 TaxID=3075433 RepID=UPI0028FD0B4A|nr:STAS domain-containing protein [Phycicoccus sp. M110.8]MDU0313134.1 STAS domain-containing protein [Phycicoccus sp. M110.8]
MTTIEEPSTGTRSAALHESSLTQDLLVLRSTVADVLLTRSHRVVVDVSCLDRPSSTAVAALLWAKRSCARAGVDFQVHGARPANRDVLRRCGLVVRGGGAG